MYMMCGISKCVLCPRHDQQAIYAYRLTVLEQASLSAWINTRTHANIGKAGICTPRLYRYPRGALTMLGIWFSAPLQEGLILDLRYPKRVAFHPQLSKQEAESMWLMLLSG